MITWHRPSHIMRHTMTSLQRLPSLPSLDSLPTEWQCVQSLQQLVNSGKITYKVDAYPINIYDSESALAHGSMHGHSGQDLNAVKLMVFDQWTLNDVKKAYSKMTKKPFMEKEKFLSQERELEDDQPLWKLRLRDNEKLIIEREQQEVMVTYICCECGQEVQLRRYDSVQCRQCFHGAVYKQRTARVCQYSCR